MTDHYRTLQVDPDADPEVIQAAYRRLARKYHPDTNRFPDAERQMTELNLAYETLSDATKRSTYDQLRRKSGTNREWAFAAPRPRASTTAQARPYSEATEKPESEAKPLSEEEYAAATKKADAISEAQSTWVDRLLAWVATIFAAILGPTVFGGPVFTAVLFLEAWLLDNGWLNSTLRGFNERQGCLGWLVASWLLGWPTFGVLYLAFRKWPSAKTKDEAPPRGSFLS